MTELRKEEDTARPPLGRAFLKHWADQLPCLKSHFIFWPLMICGLALDLWSKKAIFDWLRSQHPDGFSVIDGFLRFVRALNDGAIMGMAAGQRFFLVAASVIALIVILAVFLFSRTRQNLFHVSLGLLTAGVCGNLYDRMFNDGLVRDFIDVVYWPGKHWPTFNIADSMLCIGVALMFITSLDFQKKPE